MIYRKKLIEVALPLDAINKASAREKSIRHGHPSTLHLWWARRPLAAARAVIFAQMVDDPSAHPEQFPSKAMIEIPPKFAGRQPVNPEARQDKRLITEAWYGAKGLAEDVRHYGQWMRDEAEKRIGHLYPKIEITAEMAKERPDLEPLVGCKLTVIAWLWARTVKSPNPACAQVDVPLASTFMLSTKVGKEAYVEPVVEEDHYHFTTKVRKPKDIEAAKRGTKSGSSGSSFLCLISGTPMPFDYLRSEAKAGRMGTRLMAIVVEGERGRLYLSPTQEAEAIAQRAYPEAVPDTDLPKKALGFRIQEYGMTKWCDLFTPRQLVTLTTFSDLVQETRERVKRDALAAGWVSDGGDLANGGTGAEAYSDAVAVYLGLLLSRLVDLNNALCQWRHDPAKQHVGHMFSRQAIPMVWDFAEANPLGNSASGFDKTFVFVPKIFPFLCDTTNGITQQADAATQSVSMGKVVSTDPPYYDNVPYSDLSDFFYVWLRRSLKSAFPALFATLAVPKAEELVAFAYRHNSKAGAEAFFLDGMTQAMRRLAEQAHPAFPVTIYYAFKQAESDGAEGAASTGWETFLDAVIRAGLAITGTWPMRTELANRMRSIDSNALASSIILVCRSRAADAPTATRREFLTALKTELPNALIHLQRGNIAPVDLAQAAIGPGMAVYTRYARVLDAEGKLLAVREALAWFEQSGFTEGEYGVAETLSTAKNTSVVGMVEAGILTSRGGKVRLLRPDELPTDWNPATDSRLTAWEVVHHLIRVLEAGGESAAADLVVALGSHAATARELAYRLYTLCKRKKRAHEALSYNGLVQSWPEIARLARETPQAPPVQTALL